MTEQASRSGLQAALGQGDARVCIAVLDGPVDVSHSCLRGADLTRIETAVSGQAADGKAAAHGTHVASIIFGQPESSVVGISPRCRGLIVPIFGDGTHDADLVCSQLDLARAILLALENGADIINVSGGQLAPSGEPEPILADAISRCFQRDVVIVAAAGNDGCACLHVPAASPSVLAVGAMDDDGRPFAASNWGGIYGTQGILAPGVDVIGAAPGDGVVRKSGTSFAAPFVSGLIGLLASRQLQAGRTPDFHAIRSAILGSATPCAAGSGDDCARLLRGRLNVPKLIKVISGGESTMTDISVIQLEDEPVRSAVRAAERESGPAPEPPRIPERAQVSASHADDDKCSCGGNGKCSCGGRAGCSCGGDAAAKPQIVYALGKIGYDFGSEARRDSLLQAMPTEANNLLDQEHLLNYLTQNPFDAASLIWTLNLDATPIYAIQPVGPFAATTYERLREFMHGQLHDGVELVSIPGAIGGKMRLQSGQVVPVVVPALRGMYSWATEPLVTAVLGPRPRVEAEATAYDLLASGIGDFLSRVYYDLRNLGITGEERAINYSATNAVQIADVVRATTRDALDLDTLTVKRSPVCRPDSDCYDVQLSFFNPNNVNVANRIFRFTVDVSDVVPVSIGSVRSWTRRA